MCFQQDKCKSVISLSFNLRMERVLNHAFTPIYNIQNWRTGQNMAPKIITLLLYCIYCEKWFKVYRHILCNSFHLLINALWAESLWLAAQLNGTSKATEWFHLYFYSLGKSEDPSLSMLMSWISNRASQFGEQRRFYSQGTFQMKADGEKA